MSRTKILNGFITIPSNLKVVMLLLAAVTGIVHETYPQEPLANLPKLKVDMEIRPRAEYRGNYSLPTDSSMPDLYATQRNRISVTYTGKSGIAHAALQEIHVWGKPGAPSYVGGINAYELFIEPRLTRHLSVRIGRQALSLDNGRLFSSAPWAQQGRSHEGIRLLVNSGAIHTDFTVAFTRPYSTRFDNAYSPVAAHQYKLLLLHHLHYPINDRFTLTTINAVDRFDRYAGVNGSLARMTNGGRITYRQKHIELTAAAYYQHGLHSSRSIQAYYIQPEVSVRQAGTTFRLGTEIISGDRHTATDDVSRSFVPLYGVAWKFMGNMNLFTRFPEDVNSRGLVNPYLFIIHSLNDNLSVRGDGHLFYSQYPMDVTEKMPVSRYLGFESDLSVNFKPMEAVELTIGCSYLIPTGSMELLNKISNPASVPIWSYLMVSYRPVLWRR